MSSFPFKLGAIFSSSSTNFKIQFADRGYQTFVLLQNKRDRRNQQRPSNSQERQIVPPLACLPSKCLNSNTSNILSFVSITDLQKESINIGKLVHQGLNSTHIRLWIHQYSCQYAYKWCTIKLCIIHYTHKATAQIKKI